MVDFDDDSLLVIDDVDIGDETELRRIVAEVENLVGVPGQGLRVSVLTTEQWQTVVKRMVPRTMRRGAEVFFYMLRDPRDPQHLLVSPSAVRGINEQMRQIQQEVVYTTLRAIPTELSKNLRKGVDDVLAEECASRLNLDLYVRTYPRQSKLVKAMLGVLSKDFSYDTTRWAVAFRRNPERIFLALKRSPFWSHDGMSSDEFIDLITQPRISFSELDEVIGEMERYAKGGEK